MSRRAAAMTAGNSGLCDIENVPERAWVAGAGDGTAHPRSRGALKKPFSLAELREVLTDLCGGRSGEQLDAE